MQCHVILEIRIVQTTHQTGAIIPMVGPLMVFTIKFKRFFIHVSSILGPRALVNKILDLFDGPEL